MTDCRSAILAVLIAMTAVAAGCSAPSRNPDAVSAFYRYDFPAAREAVRGDAMLKDDENTILDNTRLGLAALADGDLDEAETALGRSFELLSTAGLNKDRTVSAALVSEGVRIWKGEPFEQALTYHQVATLYALKGDWENCRAAAANSIFRLTDFGANQVKQERSPDQRRDAEPVAEYTAVDTNFALGFLMQAIGSDLSGAAGGQGQFESAVQINPELQTLTDTLAAREYDTLLIVDYGRGPTKIAYGPDQSLVRFEPCGPAAGELVAWAGATTLARLGPVCDVNAMAIDHRWNNFEEVRKAKSMVGNALLFGGMGATAVGAHHDDSTVALAGLGAIALGLISKAGAQGDTRHCEFFPQAIYLVPLRLEASCDLRITIEGDERSMVMLDDVIPGQPGQPRVIHLRLLGQHGPPAPWLAQREARYGNDHISAAPGELPWILGGSDVSTPSRDTLHAYQDGGALSGFTVTDLVDLYFEEGILLGSGRQNAPGEPKNPSFRHILEGGTGLFTPWPYSVGYKRLMCGSHSPYIPRSDRVRELASRVHVDTADAQHRAAASPSP